MFKFLLKRFTDAHVLSELEELKNDFAQLSADVKLFETEIMDNVLVRVEKLNKRMATRFARETASVADKEPKPQPIPEYVGGYKIRGSGGKL